MNPDESANFVKKVGNFISNLLLGQTKEVIVRTDQRVQSIEKSIEELKGIIQSLSGSVGSHETHIAVMKSQLKIYGIANSPMVPTDKGNKLLEESKFNQQYPLIRDRVFAYLEAKNTRTLYDFEIVAKQALENFQSDPAIDPIKDFVVNHPTDYSLDLIFNVASWVIRDDYAREKGIEVKHDKKK